MLYIYILFINIIFSTTMIIDASDWDQNSWTYLNMSIESIVYPDVPENHLGWDLAFHRYHIRTNSGLSGVGNGGAYMDSLSSWDDSSYILFNEFPDESFFISDTIVNGFYDINNHIYVDGIANPVLETWSYIGGNFQMEYTNNKFVVKNSLGDKYFKLWVEDYYNENGVSGHITITFDEINQIMLGDINEDYILDILDLVVMINLILNFEYNQLADVNNNEIVDILDIVTLVSWIMNGVNGCMDSVACNYNPNANIDDESCIYPETGYDCLGNCISDDGCYDCPQGIYCITSDTLWSSNDDIILNQQVLVANNAILTIEPGSVIKLNPSAVNGVIPSIIISRGSQIIAEGNSLNPITFTSLYPNQSSDLQNWGALIILGNAPISNLIQNNFNQFPFELYGGNDVNDNSGVLKYVRVWHGGNSLLDNEKYGAIILAGVGRGTEIKHCEVAYSKRDGFDIYGGTVDLKYCASINSSDDGFDINGGYQGRGQYLYALKNQNLGSCISATNQGDSNINVQPRTHPKFSNITCDANNGLIELFNLTNGVGGDFRNVLLVNAQIGIFNNSIGSEVLTQMIDDIPSYPDYLYISQNSLLWNIVNPFISNTSNINFNYIELDPGLSNGILLPTANGPAFDDLDELQITVDNFYDSNSFKGAFGTENWLDGWSILFPLE